VTVINVLPAHAAVALSDIGSRDPPFTLPAVRTGSDKQEMATWTARTSRPNRREWV
jgi:hypothetical protein